MKRLVPTRGGAVPVGRSPPPPGGGPRTLGQFVGRDDQFARSIFALSTSAPIETVQSVRGSGVAPPANE